MICSFNSTGVLLMWRYCEIAWVHENDLDILIDYKLNELEGVPKCMIPGYICRNIVLILQKVIVPCYSRGHNSISNVLFKFWHCTLRSYGAKLALWWKYQGEVMWYHFSCLKYCFNIEINKKKEGGKVKIQMQTMKTYYAPYRKSISLILKHIIKSWLLWIILISLYIT